MPSEVGNGNTETSKALGKSWASSAPRLLSVAFSVCATLFFSRPLGAETCSSDIELLLDTVSPTDIAQICPSSKSEWTIRFDVDSDRWPSDFDGSPLTIFAFRRKNWLLVEPNNLNPKLSQISKHVWELNFVTEGATLPSDPTQPQFLWVRDTQGRRLDRGASNETDARYFYCLVTDKTMCRTSYSAPICQDYSSGLLEREGVEPDNPEFIASAESSLPPAELLETFGPINDQVDELIQRVTAHSCRKGYSKND